MTTVRISALRHSAFYSPLLVAIGGGFLQRAGLTPDYAPAPMHKPVQAGLEDGSYHVAQSAVATHFAALERGEQPVTAHFAQINARDGFFIAARVPDADFHWQKLAGKTVLVDHFFQPLAMLKYGLHRAGVAYTDIRAVDVGDVAAIDAAFRRGEGDYVHQQGPAPQQMSRDGIAHVVAAVGDAVGPVAFSSLCARRDWLRTDMAHAFTHAYAQARAFTVSADAPEIAAIIAPFFPAIDRMVLTETVATYQRLGCWEPAIEISRASYEALLDVFAFNGLISRRHPYEAAVAAPPV